MTAVARQVTRLDAALDRGNARAVYFLTTPRLGFRTWRDDDLELAVGLWNDPEVTRFIGGPPGAAAVAERLARERATQAAHGVQYWPIFLLADGDHVGCCGLRPYRPDDGVLELGVHIRPRHWRQGLALEAAQAVIRHAFEVLGARGLFAGHHPANRASRELLLRLGFVFTHEELYPPTGLCHPSYRLDAGKSPAPGA
jgi:RimJ/RimL family protein N-acetyltransferase